MKRTVLVFGTFDPLHAGHRSFLRQAKAVGGKEGWLEVVVARDSAIRVLKQRAPGQPEVARLSAVRAVPEVNQAILGDDWPVADPFRLLGVLDFDVVALGYDQEPTEEKVKVELAKHGRKVVEVVRLQPFYPEKYKSSRLRTLDKKLRDA